MLPVRLTASRLAHTTLRQAPTTLRSFSASALARGQMEAAIRDKLTASLAPTHLAISNDSAAHRHHAPMRESGGGNGETHFTVQVVSAEFEGKRAIARHRLVNDALKDEFAAGLHALVIKAKSPTEYNAAESTK